MAKPSKVWLRKSDGFYYSTVRGEQVKLSEDKGEAERALHAILAQKEPEVREVAAFPTFRKISDLFLKDSKQKNKATTFRMHYYFLQSFCDHVKKRRVNDLKVHHVTEWVQKPRKHDKPWGQSSACSARGTVLACLNWAVDQGYIESHPLGKLKRGSHKRRERIFTPEELLKIREFTNPQFSDFLHGLELTGARPFSELAKLTADMIDWDAQIIPFAEHKNDGKNKSRTIYLTPELTTLLKRLAEKHPTGLLFRNCKGKEWTSHDATRRLHYCTTKLKMPKGTIYGVRHFRITAALEKGLSANVIGELVGNSPVTISRYYDHLSKKRSTMLEAAKKAIG